MTAQMLVGCVSGSPVDNPLNLDPKYASDPTGFIKHAQSDAVHQGMTLLLHLPGGYTGTGPYEARLPTDPKATSAICDAVSTAPTAIYVGQYHTDGSRMSLHNPVTQKWFSVDLRPYLDSGLELLFIDGLSGNQDDAYLLHDMARCMGLELLIEAAPLTPTGRLSTVECRKYNWGCKSEFFKLCPGSDLWKVPPTGQYHMWCDEWARDSNGELYFPTPSALADFARARKSRGFTVGMLRGSSPEIAAVIGAPA